MTDEQMYRFDQSAARNTETILKLATACLRAEDDLTKATALMMSKLNETGVNLNLTLAVLALRQALAQQMPSDPS